MAPSAPELLRDEAGVARVVAAARAAGRAALDLEFLWERTYTPLACLAQIAVEGVVALIDPIAGAPLGPVAELVSDPTVTVVMHAPSSDLALFEMCFDSRPAALRDVQTTAGFVGLGAGQGLGTLLERALGVGLDKSERFTDWSRRPLSARQLAYAAADVEHLLRLSDTLDALARVLGREGWVDEEHERRYGPHARFSQDPDDAWRRVKGQGRLNSRDRAVLRALAAWREREARRQDRPSAWLVPDRSLIEIARRRPANRAALTAERSVPERLRPAVTEGLLSAIREGAGAPPLELAPAPSRQLAERLEVLGPLAAVMVASRAAAVDLAPSLLATREEINAHLLGALEEGEGGGPLAAGWRYALAGAALESLARGELALASGPRRPYLIELSRPGHVPEGAAEPAGHERATPNGGTPVSEGRPRDRTGEAR